MMYLSYSDSQSDMKYFFKELFPSVNLLIVPPSSSFDTEKVTKYLELIKNQGIVIVNSKEDNPEINICSFTHLEDKIFLDSDNLLELWDSTIPKFDKSLKFKVPIIYGTGGKCDFKGN